MGILGTAAGAVLGFAQQASQNRFNAEEAQKNRDWQEQMSNTAYQRQVADMQAAGVNPALMYGGAGASGASTPSGSAASGAGFNALADAISVAKLGEELKGLHLDNKNKELANQYQGLVNQFYPDLTQGQLDEIASRIGVNRSNIDLNDARKSLTEAQTVIEKLNAEWLPKLNAAKEKNDLASAAHSYAEAAISEMEKEIGHRLGNSDILAICDSIAALTGKTLPGVANEVADTLKGRYGPVIDAAKSARDQVSGFVDRIDAKIDSALDSWQPRTGFGRAAKKAGLGLSRYPVPRRRR